MDTSSTYTVATTLPAASILLAVAILLGGLLACITVAIAVTRWAGIKDEKVVVDIDLMNSNLECIGEQLGAIKDALASLDATVKRLDHEQRVYDTIESKHTLQYLDTWMGTLHKQVEMENTLLIEQVGTRLDKIEAHMALLAVKVPDMNDEPKERGHVDGTSQELPAITPGGVGSGAESSAPTETSTQASRPGKRRRSAATA